MYHSWDPLHLGHFRKGGDDPDVKHRYNRKSLYKTTPHNTHKEYCRDYRLLEGTL